MMHQLPRGVLGVIRTYFKVAQQPMRYDKCIDPYQGQHLSKNAPQVLRIKSCKPKWGTLSSLQKVRDIPVV